MGERVATLCTRRGIVRAPLAARAVRALLRLAVTTALLYMPIVWVDTMVFGAAQARDDGNREAERQREEMQQAQREQERQAREQARQLREQERQAREQEREQARQAREQERQAREQAKQAREQAKEAREQAQQAKAEAKALQSQKQDQSTNTSNADRSSQQAGGKTTSQQKQSDGSSSSKAQSKNAKDNAKDKTKDDDDSKDVGDAIDDAGPPTTMVGVFNKLFGSGQPASGKTDSDDADADTPKSRPAPDKSSMSDKTGKSDKSGTSDGPGTSGKAQPGTANNQDKDKAKDQVTAKQDVAKKGGPPPPLGDVMVQHNEVLAVNPSKRMITSAVAKGFKPAEQNKLSGLSVSVTRLIAPAGMSMEQANRELAAIAADATGGSFAPNQRYRIYKTATGNAASASSAAPSAGLPCSGDHCYGRDVMGWDGALKSCAKGVGVGIIDTSVDTTHPAFKNKSIQLSHQQATKAGKSPDWHGTGVLAILAGDDASPTPGLIPDADFFVADAFFADEDGEPATDTMSLLKALDWLKKKDVKLVNMSLSGPADELIRSAINAMSDTGVIFVAAAGNDGPQGQPSYPAAYPQVLAVTAINKNLSSYANATRGRYVDLAAPGVAIWTALPGARQGYHSGTSFAAPYVTAAVASLYRRLGEKSKPGVLQQVSFKDLGEPGRDPVYGNGLLLAPSTCGTSSVASTGGGAIVTPAAAVPAPKPVGFGFQSSSVSSGVGLEVLPWLAGAGAR